MQTFEGRVAVITGGAEGIGKALAEQAAALGMKLVLADIHGAKLDATVAAFVARGIDASGLRTDVARAEQVQALADFAFARHGAVHLLFNNAGVACAKPVWELSTADWDWVVGVNLYGVTHALRSFVPRMLEGGDEGHIVNTASMAGLLSQPTMATYNATKHGVVTVSECLHYELSLRGARLKASVLCPAWVKTNIAFSERNRSLSTGEASASTPCADPLTGQVASAVIKAVEHGIEPTKVAEIVFQAIRDERFYILTHPSFKPLVKLRMEDILEERAPTFVPPR